MSVKQKTYATEFKAKVALEAIKGELTINQITAKYGVHLTQISRWKLQALQAIKQMFLLDNNRIAYIAQFIEFSN